MDSELPRPPDLHHHPRRNKISCWSSVELVRVDPIWQVRLWGINKHGGTETHVQEHQLKTWMEHCIASQTKWMNFNASLCGDNVRAFLPEMQRMSFAVRQTMDTSWQRTSREYLMDWVFEDFRIEPSQSAAFDGKESPLWVVFECLNGCSSSSEWEYRRGFGINNCFDMQ